jgi:hypothetical protein
MNAIIEHPHFPDTTGTSAQGRYTVLTANRQADFLKHLQMFGNVRLACRAACISAQTAYRARRASPGFALAWDASMLAARTQAEAVLADRAINGVEEAVYYHGEEVARRRRYDSRLLLAHLARLDRLEEREEVSGALSMLDGWIEALEAGADLDALAGRGPGGRGPDAGGRDGASPPLEAGGGIDRQDRVPCVPSCRNGEDEQEGAEEPEEGADESGAAPDGHALRGGEWLEDRLERMDAARPAGAATPGELAQEWDGLLRDGAGPGADRPLDAGEIEAAQLAAFEARAESWWLVLGPLAEGARGRGEDRWWRAPASWEAHLRALSGSDRGEGGAGGLADSA